MALSTVIRCAVTAVRAYFQRDWNAQIMNSDEIPPAAIPVMRAVYRLLGVVFLIISMVNKAPLVTNLLGIDCSRSLYVALYEVSTGFYWFWAVSFWWRRFSFFYRFSEYLFYIGTLEWIASLVSGHPPFFTFEVYLASSWFVTYVAAHSQLMARRIVEKGENSRVIHAIYLFTDFPYVSYHFARMKVEEIRRCIGGRVPDHQL